MMRTLHGKTWVAVMPFSHPRLFMAFETISHDIGMGLAPVYWIPEGWHEHLHKAEAALATLTSDELETFCIGEESEMEAIYMRNADLFATYKMLNAFFNDWETQDATKH